MYTRLVLEMMLAKCAMRIAMLGGDKNKHIFDEAGYQDIRNNGKSCQIGNTRPIHMHK